ncbi:1-deoxy-D-xylulose-5-phosphate synthase N-terminal domain-containing protein [Methylobacterium sp. GC_Met_2]|uniref:transketolase n=1 Tax=Methylobacterium sp. GC_Met_2 TaxID=2937376 RepID=UPI00226B64DD|nr:1-deoxy-D-xylulose-5-phosphate synthase N-terminal domain-containing protein [Methylobacterium sp. GC_Met_2]
MQNDLAALRERARWVWRETLAIHQRAPETRIASSLSPIEIFVALYYGGILKFDPENPYAPERDRCIISKGHGSICMYPILADLGFFPAEELMRVCHRGGFLGGIPDPVIPGYETVNGSLGHGLGVGSGMAIGSVRAGQSRNVFVICGDGEMHEGSNWEAVMFAGHHGLDNLNLVIDDNATAMLDHTRNIIGHGDLAARLRAFGWDAEVIEDGHDVNAVYGVLAAMKDRHAGRPKAAIARTIKGRGMPGIENASLSHVMALKPEILSQLLEEL